MNEQITTPPILGNLIHTVIKSKELVNKKKPARRQFRELTAPQKNSTPTFLVEVYPELEKKYKVYKEQREKNHEKTLRESEARKRQKEEDLKDKEESAEQVALERALKQQSVAETRQQDKLSVRLKLIRETLTLPPDQAIQALSDHLGYGGHGASTEKSYTRILLMNLSNLNSEEGARARELLGAGEGSSENHFMYKLATSIASCAEPIKLLAMKLKMRFQNEKPNIKRASQATMELVNQAIMNNDTLFGEVNLIKQYLVFNKDKICSAIETDDGVVFANKRTAPYYLKNMDMFPIDHNVINQIKRMLAMNETNVFEGASFLKQAYDISRSHYMGVGDIYGQVYRMNEVFKVKAFSDEHRESRYENDFVENIDEYFRDFIGVEDWGETRAFFSKLLDEDGSPLPMTEWNLNLSTRVYLPPGREDEFYEGLGATFDREYSEWFILKKAFDFNSTNLKGQAGPGFGKLNKGDVLDIAMKRADDYWDVWAEFGLAETLRRYPEIRYVYAKPKSEAQDLAEPMADFIANDSYSMTAGETQDFLKENKRQKKIRSIFVNNFSNTIRLQMISSLFDKTIMNVFDKFWEGDEQFLRGYWFSLKGWSPVNGNVDMLMTRAQNMKPFEDSPKAFVASYSDNVFMCGPLGSDFEYLDWVETIEFSPSVSHELRDKIKATNEIPAGVNCWVSLDGSKMEASCTKLMGMAMLGAQMNAMGCPPKFRKYILEVASISCIDALAILGNLKVSLDMNVTGCPPTFLFNDGGMWNVGRQAKKEGWLQKDLIFPIEFCDIAKSCGVKLKIERVVVLPPKGAPIIQTSNTPCRIDLLGNAVIAINQHNILNGSNVVILPVLEEQRLVKSLMYMKKQYDEDSNSVMSNNEVLAHKCVSLMLSGGCVSDWSGKLLSNLIVENAQHMLKDIPDQVRDDDDDDFVPEDYALKGLRAILKDLKTGDSDSFTQTSFMVNQYLSNQYLNLYNYRGHDVDGMNKQYFARQGYGLDPGSERKPKPFSAQELLKMVTKIKSVKNSLFSRSNEVAEVMTRMGQEQPWVVSYSYKDGKLVIDNVNSSRERLTTLASQTSLKLKNLTWVLETVLVNFPSIIAGFVPPQIKDKRETNRFLESIEKSREQYKMEKRAAKEERILKNKAKLEEEEPELPVRKEVSRLSEGIDIGGLTWFYNSDDTTDQIGTGPHPAKSVFTDAFMQPLIRVGVLFRRLQFEKEFLGPVDPGIEFNMAPIWLRLGLNPKWNSLLSKVELLQNVVKLARPAHHEVSVKDIPKLVRALEAKQDLLRYSINDNELVALQRSGRLTEKILLKELTKYLSGQSIDYMRRHKLDGTSVLAEDGESLGFLFLKSNPNLYSTPNLLWTHAFTSRKSYEVPHIAKLKDTTTEAKEDDEIERKNKKEKEKSIEKHKKGRRREFTV